MILLIDNYDSFTYNLVQRFGRAWTRTLDVRVFRNDQITPEQVAELQAVAHHHLAGAVHAAEAGVSNDILRRFAPTVPILGVCLGHQCIGHVFGGEVVRNYRIMHGKTSPIYHDDQGVFRGLSNPFEATRVSQPGDQARDVPRTRISSSRPGPTRARSWACATRPGRCTACSSTRRAFSRSKAPSS